MNHTSEIVLAINEQTRSYATEADHHHLLGFHGWINGTSGDLFSKVVFCRNTLLEWDDQGDELVNRFIRSIPYEEDTFWGQTLAALRRSFVETQPQLVEALSRQRTSLEADPEDLSLSKDEIANISKDWTTLMASTYQRYLRVLWKRDGHGTETCNIRTASMDSEEIASALKQTDKPIQSRYIKYLTNTEPYDSFAQEAEGAVSDVISFLTRDGMISQNRARISHSSGKPALLVNISVTRKSPASIDEEKPKSTRQSIPISLTIGFSFCSNATAIDGLAVFQTPQIKILRDLTSDPEWSKIEKGLVDTQAGLIRSKVENGEEFNESMSSKIASTIFIDIRKELKTFLETKIPGRSLSDDPLIYRVTAKAYEKSLNPDKTITLKENKKKGKRPATRTEGGVSQ